jgi:hypothetical protein
MAPSLGPRQLTETARQMCLWVQIRLAHRIAEILAELDYLFHQVLRTFNAAF